MFKNTKIMVPIDFTPITDKALLYANHFAAIFENNLMLLHVAEKRNHTAAEKLLSAKAAENNLNKRINTTSLVCEGNIFDVISKTANESDASLVIMGTHGIKGTQKYFGSHAMKVITSSKVPYLITQNKSFENIDNILIPVDFSMEIKQVLKFTEEVGQHFNATIHLLPKAVGDAGLQRKIDLNIQYMKNYFHENGLDVHIVNNHYDKNITKDVVKNAEALNCKMIVIIIDPETGLTDYLTGSFEQKIIANDAEIPVMCINMKTVRFFSYDVPVKG